MEAVARSKALFPAGVGDSPSPSGHRVRATYNYGLQRFARLGCNGRRAPGVTYAISTNTESEVQVRDTPEEGASDPEVSNARQLVRGLERQLTSSSSSIDIEEEVVDKGEAESSPALSGFEGSVKGMILLNIGAALFGSNQVVIKTTEDLLGPAELSALRFLIAAACFTPAILQGVKKPAMRKAAAELGTYLFAGYQLQAMGLALTTAGRGAFTGTFTVLTVPILVGLSGRKIGWKTWTAAAVALLGVALLTTDGADPNKGDLFCILSAICFGVHKWRTEVVTARFRDETTQLVSLQLAALAVLSSFFCVPALVGNVEANGVLGVLQQAPQLPWLPLVFMGLGTTAFTLWIEMESLKEVSAPLAALIYTAEPVWGAGFAWLLLEERWSSAGWVGAMLVICSSLASQLAGDTVEKVGSKPAAEAAAPSSKRD